MTKVNQPNTEDPGKITGRFELMFSRVSENAVELEITQHPGTEATKSDVVPAVKVVQWVSDLVTFQIKDDFVLVTLNLKDRAPAFTFGTLMFDPRCVFVTFNNGDQCFAQNLTEATCSYLPGDEHKPHYLHAGGKNAVLLRLQETQVLAMPKHSSTTTHNLHKVTPELIYKNMLKPDEQTTELFIEFLTQVEADKRIIEQLPRFLAFMLQKFSSSYLLKAAASEFCNVFNPRKPAGPQAKLYITQACEDVVSVLGNFTSERDFKKFKQMADTGDRVSVFVTAVMLVLLHFNYLDNLVAQLISNRTKVTSCVPIEYLQSNSVKVVSTGTLLESSFPVVVKLLPGFALGTTIDYIVKLHHVDAFIREPGKDPVIWRENRAVEKLNPNPFFLGHPTTHSSLAHLKTIAMLAHSPAKPDAAQQRPSPPTKDTK